MPEPADDAEMIEQYRHHALALVDALEAALPGWAGRRVRDRVVASGRPFDGAARAAAEAAAQRTAAEVVAKVRTLVLTDPDEQRTNPLSVLRAGTAHLTAALHELGVPEIERDEFAQGAFPEDVYDLAPASFSDVDPAVHEPGLAWGAAKAHVHLTRRRREGRR